MGKTADDYEGTYTEPELRERLKEEIKSGDRGGRPGQWSARKSQLLTTEYEAAGGGYVGDDDERTDAQRSLQEWTDEEWQTADGSTDARQDDGTVERYLPKEAWEQLSTDEQEATRARKREGSEHGEQHVANTDAAQRARRLAEVLAHAEDDTIDDLDGRLDGLGEPELRAVLAHEREHEDRKGARQAVQRRIDRLDEG